MKSLLIPIPDEEIKDLEFDIGKNTGDGSNGARYLLETKKVNNYFYCNIKRNNKEVVFSAPLIKNTDLLKQAFIKYHKIIYTGAELRIENHEED